jgi:glycosyltransferase involved in cell wall biosynthesis
MKVALVHYWLVTMRGGEKVLEALCEMFPDADIYTHVYDKTKISPIINRHKIYTTSVSRLPFAKKLYTKYLTFMPAAIESIDLSGYDLVISSESGPAKGVIIPSTIPHLCYCHTPMRYLWDYYHRYLKESSFLTRAVFKAAAGRLRIWDLATANRVTAFAANSNYVKTRIKAIYRREAEVIYPPVDTYAFQTQPKGDYYLFLGQLVGYKRADLAIEAFRKNGKKLLIIGGGKPPKNLPKNITVLGFVSNEERNSYLARARALIFPGEEDFGIVPVESIASGTPVIAYGRGGALETVSHEVSGLFFYEQSTDALLQAVEAFEKIEHKFDAKMMRLLAASFDKTVFVRKMRKKITALMNEFHKVINE